MMKAVGKFGKPRTLSAKFDITVKRGLPAGRHKKGLPEGKPFLYYAPPEPFLRLIAVLGVGLASFVGTVFAGTSARGFVAPKDRVFQ